MIVASRLSWNYLIKSNLKLFVCDFKWLEKIIYYIKKQTYFTIVTIGKLDTEW